MINHYGNYVDYQEINIGDGDEPPILILLWSLYNSVVLSA